MFPAQEMVACEMPLFENVHVSALDVVKGLHCIKFLQSLQRN